MGTHLIFNILSAIEYYSSSVCYILLLFSVANKWLHERGQEFHRPCTLENQATDEVDVRH